MTEILLDSELTSQQRTDLLTVRSSAESLLTVLNDILDFSKIEAGKLTLEPIPFDVRDSIDKIVRSVGVLAQQKELEVLCEFAPDVPDFAVGDPTRLRQILVNLMGNAVKFTERGEVGVQVSVEQASETSTTLHFAVSDTGIGIPAEKHETVFAAFTQAEASTTRKHGGTGLGLTISMRLVALMGGRMWLESAPGKGSRFHFTVQFGIAPPQPGSQARFDAALLAGRRVAIVDDNATNRRILTETVTRWGMCASLAANAEDALLMLHSAARSGSPFPLIVSDVHMADMDGFALAMRILDDPELCDMKIILLTSGGQRGDAARCREIGVAAYLTKPVSASDLLAAVASVLDAGPKADQIQPPIAQHALRRNLPGLHILVAEDNPVNQQLVRRLLEKHHHEVVIVEDGRKAVAAVGRERFDLVLMDVQMPEMDGLEATAAIRNLEKTSGEHRRIVAMTAYAMNGDRERCLAAGMDGYLTKPIRPNELTELLDSVRAGSDALGKQAGPVPGS
jgi:CheY-like chemotaxis protein